VGNEMERALMRLDSRIVILVVTLTGWYQMSRGIQSDQDVTTDISEEIVSIQHTLKQLLSHDTKSLVAWFEQQEETGTFVLQAMKRRKNNDVSINQQEAQVAWIKNTKRSLTAKNERPETSLNLGHLFPDTLLSRIANPSIRSSLILFKTQGTIEPFLDTFYSLTKENDLNEYVSCLGVIYALIFNSISQVTNRDHKEETELPASLQSHLPLGTSAAHSTQQPVSQEQETGFVHGVHVAVSLVGVFDEFNKLPIMQAIKTIASLIKEIKSLVQKIELQTGGNLPLWLKDNWVMIPFAVGIVIIRVIQYFLPLFSTYHKEYTNA
jgi:hypothetical protein